ncbi:MAG: radical SAM protein [Candidatus Woesearchaeota archaeon]|nr:MAG: radical SAM protein [Candidatus Woesearchaeota archaeon]
MSKKDSKFSTEKMKNIFSDVGRGVDLNYRKYRLKWIYAPKLKLVTKFPLHLDIEASSGCNLRCIMCFNAVKRTPPGLISWNLYKKIIDEGSKNNLCSIKLNWRGEPLLHPKIVEMVDYAKKKGIIDVQFNTNGQLLDKEKADGLIEAGLDRIIFSIDGASKDVYERIRVGGSYDKLTENVEYFLKRKKELNAVKPFVRVQMVKLKQNEHEINKFVDFWEPKVDEVFVNPEIHYKENKPYVEGSTIVGRKACSMLWQRLVISYDGKVMMCCGDWKMKSILGDVNKETIHNIWNGKKLNAIRKHHKNLNHHLIPACKDCLELESYKLK